MAPTASGSSSITMETEQRAVKRQKQDATAQAASSPRAQQQSRLFAPFRALGFITTAVAPALSVRRGGKDATQLDLTIVTSLGNAWAMWGINQGMPLLFVGPSLADPIRALAITQSPDSVLAVSGSKVWQYIRGKLAAVFDTADEQRQDWYDDEEDESESDEDEDEENNGKVQRPARPTVHGTTLGPSLLVFADYVLSLSDAGDKLFVWSLLTHTLLRVITFPAAATRAATAATPTFTAITMEHPATYLNKVIITSAEGGAQLWNVRTGSLIYTFAPERLQAFAGLHTSPGGANHANDIKLVAVAQSPAVDILAFGYSSGHILLHDIRKDEPVLRARVQDGIPSPHVQEDLKSKKVSQDYALAHVIQGATRPITFRTDGIAQSMAVGTRVGTVAVFDLESDGLDALDELLVGTANASQADAASIVAAQTSASGHIRGARLAQTIRNAHDDAVPLAYTEFIPGQPLLLTAAGDNKLRQWFFEPATADGKVPQVKNSAAAIQGGGVPRLLKSREGHHAPPVLIRHYGEDGKNILSAGSDRSLRCISVVRDSRSYELSQGSLQKKSTALSLPLSSLKLAPAADLAFSTTRSRDWDDVLSAHTGSATAHTWTVKDKRMGQGYLTTSPQAATSDASATNNGSSKKKKGGGGAPAGANRRLAFGTDAALPEATAVHVSACGNFGLVGGREGKVQMWNMQSYLFRKTFDCAAPVGGKAASAGVSSSSSANGKRPSGAAAVTGVTSDALNRVVIASTADGKIVFFDFASTKVVHRASISHTLGAGGSIIKMHLHTESGLLAVLCSDGHARLYDISTYRLVRDFVCGQGASAPEAVPSLTDLAFSPDGRWLVVTSSDSYIRTFDIPSGHLVDLFQTASPCTSLSFSPSSDFLATVHSDSVGVYLWLNRGLFGSVALRSIDEAKIEKSSTSASADQAISLPTVQGNEDDEELADLADEAGLDAGEPELQRTFYTSPVQLFEQDPSSQGRSKGQRGTTTLRPLITLSTMPRSRWMTLLNLDAIKARNKPKEKPKAPERAPFFLPQIAGTQLTFDVGQERQGGNANGQDAGVKNDVRSAVQGAGLDVESELGRRLRLAVESGKHAPLFQYLHSLSTPNIDLEIRSLARVQDFTNFLRAMTIRLQAHLDYEAVQAMLAVFVRVHGEALIANGVRLKSSQAQDDSGFIELDGMDDEAAEEQGRALAEAVRLLLVELHTESSRVMELLDYCLGSLSLIRDIPLV
ncbi:rRNA-processing protein utp21 [Tilletia horrida]|uniref:rRNA-processing protein utp21 n=1 Tax=Tilletia horrida TaxID=155126 RepID=A0AAN6JS40_9BASI|nr:rRNA-processing protein utp21 [Tilletia horrida]KAK0551237.1 rRNA-processing protein utp21 [Tilletia horrida]KAK0561614.1 rRNA-processing protein utp21 [Tilletia horrida]